MKKLNITKEQFNRSRYFQKKYGTLEYVSESGKVYKTSKGKLLKFNEDALDGVSKPKFKPVTNDYGFLKNDNMWEELSPGENWMPKVGDKVSMYGGPVFSDDYFIVTKVYDDPENPYQLLVDVICFVNGKVKKGLPIGTSGLDDDDPLFDEGCVQPVTKEDFIEGCLEYTK